MWHTNLDGVNFNSYDEFRNSVIGQGWDLDGLYGAQCWDGCDMVYKYIGRVLRTARYYGGDGYISTCYSDTRCRQYNGLSPMSIVTGKQNIKKGDILIFSGAFGIYAGHGGYANHDYNGSNEIELLSQNYRNASLTNGSAFSLDKVSLSAFLGAFRWSKWNGTVPPEPGPNPPLNTGGGKFPWVLMSRKLREMYT